MSWDPDGYGHMSGWGMGWGGLLMVVVRGVVILGIVALVRYLAASGQAAGGAGAPRPSAEQVLAERFARGEIEEQEYLHRRALLTR